MQLITLLLHSLAWNSARLQWRSSHPTQYCWSTTLRSCWLWERCLRQGRGKPRLLGDWAVRGCGSNTCEGPGWQCRHVTAIGPECCGTRGFKRGRGRTGAKEAWEQNQEEAEFPRKADAQVGHGTVRSWCFLGKVEKTQKRPCRTFYILRFWCVVYLFVLGVFSN